MGERSERGERRDRGGKEDREDREFRSFYRRRVCKFCVEKIPFIDFKDIQTLRGFVTDRGKIIPRRISGTCARHQRELTTAVKRARNIAFLPFTEKG